MTIVIRRTARGAGTLLLAGIVVACLAYLALSLLGFQRYVITGGSMSGTIERGDLVVEREVPVGGLEVGDVITYLPPADAGTHSLVTHRITSIDTADSGRTLFQTRGDANPDPDPWKFTLDSGTQPVVTWTVPNVGWALLTLADREIRMLAFGIPAAICAFLALLELIGALRRPRCGDGNGAAAAAGERVSGRRDGERIA